MKTALLTMLMVASLLTSVLAGSPAVRGKGTPSPRAKAAPPADPLAGRDKAESERCVECHGIDGQGAGHSNSTEAKFPKLAGQRPEYILKQIQDFRTGVRYHDQMAIMARSVGDEDVRDIAAYFASQTAMHAQGGEAHAVGRALYERGDAARGVPACIGCHGERGKGLKDNPLTPVIGGQEWFYLDKQLRDWRAGERRNSAGGVMTEATRVLTDAEIEALAHYLSGV